MIVIYLLEEKKLRSLSHRIISAFCANYQMNLIHHHYEIIFQIIRYSYGKDIVCYKRHTERSEEESIYISRNNWQEKD